MGSDVELAKAKYAVAVKSRVLNKWRWLVREKAEYLRSRSKLLVNNREKKVMRKTWETMQCIYRQRHLKRLEMLGQFECWARNREKAVLFGKWKDYCFFLKQREIVGIRYDCVRIVKRVLLKWKAKYEFWGVELKGKGDLFSKRVELTGLKKLFADWKRRAYYCRVFLPRICDVYLRFKWKRCKEKAFRRWKQKSYYIRYILEVQKINQWTRNCRRMDALQRWAFLKWQERLRFCRETLPEILINHSKVQTRSMLKFCLFKWRTRFAYVSVHIQNLLNQYSKKKEKTLVVNALQTWKTGFSDRQECLENAKHSVYRELLEVMYKRESASVLRQKHLLCKSFSILKFHAIYSASLGRKENMHCSANRKNSREENFIREIGNCQEKGSYLLIFKKKQAFRTMGKII